MRIVLGLLLFTAATSSQPLFPVEQTSTRTPSAVVFVAEGGGALLGAVAGVIPVAVILPPLTMALILSNLGNDGGETEGGELLVAAGVAGVVCVVGGTAAGVCAAGRRYTYTQTARMTSGALLGSVAGWTTGVTLLLVGTGMATNPGSKLEEAGGYAVGALGVLAVTIWCGRRLQSGDTARKQEVWRLGQLDWSRFRFCHTRSQQWTARQNPVSARS